MIHPQSTGVRAPIATVPNFIPAPMPRHRRGDPEAPPNRAAPGHVVDIRSARYTDDAGDEQETPADFFGYRYPLRLYTIGEFDFIDENEEFSEMNDPFLEDPAEDGEEYPEAIVSPRPDGYTPGNSPNKDDKQAEAERDTYMRDEYQDDCEYVMPEIDPAEEAEGGGAVSHPGADDDIIMVEGENEEGGKDGDEAPVGGKDKPIEISDGEVSSEYEPSDISDPTDVEAANEKPPSPTDDLDFSPAEYKTPKDRAKAEAALLKTFLPTDKTPGHESSSADPSKKTGAVKNLTPRPGKSQKTSAKKIGKTAADIAGLTDKKSPPMARPAKTTAGTPTPKPKGTPKSKATSKSKSAKKTPKSKASSGDADDEFTDTSASKKPATPPSHGRSSKCSLLPFLNNPIAHTLSRNTSSFTYGQ